MRLSLTLSAMVLAVSLVACGVNDMPDYRSRISTIELDARVVDSPTVLFSDVASVVEGSPDAVAMDVVETRIRERLAGRLELLGHPELVDDALHSGLAAEIQGRFPWTMARAGEDADARFLATVEEYGVTVDEAGVAMVYYDTRVEGWYAPTGTLIYEQTVRSEQPLTAIHQGHDEVSVAAARALNLLALDELSEAEFQSQVLSGADRSAFDISEELFDDTFR